MSLFTQLCLEDKRQATTCPHIIPFHLCSAGFLDYFYGNGAERVRYLKSTDMDASLVLISVISGQIKSSACSLSDRVRRGISAAAGRFESVTLLCSCLLRDECDWIRILFQPQQHSSKYRILNEQLRNISQVGSRRCCRSIGLFRLAAADCFHVF